MYKMQTEVPTLPVVHFNVHKNLNRKQNSDLERSVETKCSLPQKNITCVSTKKKNLHPLLGRPYQVNIRQQPSSEQSKLNKNSIEQRVLSAKMLRIKELQNQLADAHYQLNELGNENKLLKSLQKRQDSALRRYEGTNAQLPRIINSHHEELRVLQVKYKKLKALQKETCDLLKEKENELQQLQCQHKHLLQLSKNRNLEEREKLQLQVSDLHHRIQQQQDTIQTLHRKLTLESKSLKHQLHVEVSKRKEVQKNLDETLQKLRSLENLLDNRERRLYSSGQLLLHSNSRRFGTQSLTNLRDISSSNPFKLSNKCEKWQTNIQNNTLPIFSTSKVNDTDRADEEINSNQTLNSPKTETMTNLQQVRKYRLQKSLYKRTSSDDSEEKFKEFDFATNCTSKILLNLQNSEQSKRHGDNVQCQYEINTNNYKKTDQNQRHQNLNVSLEKQFVYSSENDVSDNESENLKDNYVNTAHSRHLHRRLISNTNDSLDSEELILLEYKDKFKILAHESKNSYKSNLDTDPEKEKLVKYQFSTSPESDMLQLVPFISNDQTQYNSDKEIESVTTSKSLLNKSQKIDQNTIHEVQVQTKSSENKNLSTQCGIQDLKEYIPGQTTVQEYNNMIQSELETDSLLKTLQSKDEQWKQNAALFVTCNELESIDIKPQTFHTNENLLNDFQRMSMKDPLNNSQHLGEQQFINKIDICEEEAINKNILIEHCDIETKNKLNKQEVSIGSRNVNMLLNDVQSHGTSSSQNTFVDINTTNEISATLKPASYIKEHLLASMKAIDDNENIELLSEDYKRHNVTNKSQTTDNLFHGVPTNMKKQQDIMKDIFDTDIIKDESISSCNKLH